MVVGMLACITLKRVFWGNGACVGLVLAFVLAHSIIAIGLSDAKMCACLFGNFKVYDSPDV